MTIHLDANWAKLAGDAHEVTDDAHRSPESETAMDLYNNGIGRGIGMGLVAAGGDTSPAAVDRLVRAYLDAGLLKILDNWSVDNKNRSDDGLLIPSNR